VALLETCLQGKACQAGFRWRQVEVGLAFRESREPAAPLGKAANKRSLAFGCKLGPDLADRLGLESGERAAKRRALAIQNRDRPGVDAQEPPHDGRLVRSAGIVPLEPAVVCVSYRAIAPERASDCDPRGERYLSWKGKDVQDSLAADDETSLLCKASSTLTDRGPSHAPMAAQTQATDGLLDQGEPDSLVAEVGEDRRSDHKGLSASEDGETPDHPSIGLRRQDDCLAVGETSQEPKRNASGKEENARQPLEAPEVGPPPRELPLESQANELEELRDVASAETADLNGHRPESTGTVILWQDQRVDKPGDGSAWKRAASVVFWRNPRGLQKGIAWRQGQDARISRGSTWKRRE